MDTAPFRIDRRAARRGVSRRRLRVASTPRPAWLELAEAGILYFGITLLPLLVVIALYQSGVIG